MLFDWNVVTGLETSLPGYVDRAVALLKEENQLMIRHPNSVLYNSLASIVSLDGFFLERDPCLACSATEVPISVLNYPGIDIRIIPISLIEMFKGML